VKAWRSWLVGILQLDQKSSLLAIPKSANPLTDRNDPTFSIRFCKHYLAT
jgi:hypothetical protein